MLPLMRRDGLLLVDQNDSPEWSAGYTVTAYRTGARVSVASAGATATVDAGHGFQANDKLIVFQPTAESGSQFELTTLRTVNAAPTAMGLSLSATLTLVEGDILINLGPDTGGATPNFDGSPALIYDSMDRSSVITESRVQSDAQGNYGYWHEEPGIWELIRNSSDIPSAVVMGLPGARPEISVQDFGAVPDNSTDNAVAFAALAAAVNSRARESGYDATVVVFPTGTYLYTSGLVFTQPVVLRFDGAVLNYTGTGKAIEMGPTGLTVLTYLDHIKYEIEGLALTGGADATYGVYWNTFLVAPRMRSCHFDNFGNAASVTVWFNSDNWDIHLWDMYVKNDSDGIARNFLRVRGDGDSGQSRLTMIGGNLAEFGIAGGYGVWVTGAASVLGNVAIQGGWDPGIRVGSYAHSTRISKCYGETHSPSGQDYWIEYGDPAGGDAPSSYLAGLYVDGCYYNSHNTDLSATAHFIGPAGTATGLESARVTNNVVYAYTASRELVKLNNSASQISNRAEGNFVNLSATAVVPHTAGANITRWAGADTEQAVAVALSASGALGTLNRSAIAITNTTGTNTMTLEASNKEGQRLVLTCAALTSGTFSFADAAGLQLAGAATWTPGANDTLEVINQGGVWRELGRSDN